MGKISFLIIRFFNLEREEREKERERERERERAREREWGETEKDIEIRK